MKLTDKLKALFFLPMLSSHFIFAQKTVHPENGARLTQVHIMFECYDIYGADSYEISIYNISRRDSSIFSKKVYAATSPNIAKLVTTGIQFGKDYSWQFRAFKKGRLQFTSDSFYFQVLQSDQVMKNSFRTEVNSRDDPGNEIIFLDRNALAMDKKGNPVWFLPVNTDSLEKMIIRDLTLTPFGTLTYLDVNGAYEKDLQGNIVWQAPNDGRVSGNLKEEYHHDLNKNNDGSYTVCGSFYKAVSKKSDQSSSSAPRYNTLIHYNADGSIRWSWNEQKSLETDTMFRHAATGNSGGHLNGFAFTKDQRKIFMSFKNMSDIFLYDIAAGKFIYHLKEDSSLKFLQQHGPFLNSRNELLVYNNNINDEDESIISHPSVLIFRYDTLTKKCRPVWEYDIHAAKFPGGIRGKEGYASEMANGNILVCTGGANYAAEITRKKEKVWESYFYYRQKNDTSWKPFSNYRCQSASSLYPLYYTLQFTGSFKNKYRFRICNAGSGKRDFKLNFSDKKNRIITTKYAGILMPGEARFIEIPVNAFEGKEFTCTIAPTDLGGVHKDYHFNLQNQ